MRPFPTQPTNLAIAPRCELELRAHSPLNNLLGSQESAANHMRRVFKVNNSFGMTQVMLEHRLISVLTRMHVEMYKYPEW